MPTRLPRSLRSLAMTVGESGLDGVLSERLAHLDALDRRRTRVVRAHQGAHIISGGRQLLNFCSNDYLGLATDPELQAAMRGASGAGASSLVTGYSPEVAELEAALADYLGRDRALVFSSGFSANVGIIDALIGKQDLAVADALNHASLIDGVRLSGARKVIAPHLDIDAMRTALADRSEANALLVSDHLFSMDGDCAAANALAQVASETNAWLMLDDAHGFGVLGDDGRGVAATLTQAELPILIGTLGKSVGCAGAFVAGSGVLIDYLVNRARTLVFSTGLPPALAAAARTGVARVAADNWRRSALTERIEQFRAGAARLGLALGASQTAIQPIVIGGDAGALRASAALEAAGCLVAAIRPPTVPDGTARLRVTLSATHSDADVDVLLKALEAAVLDRAAA